MTWTGWAPLSAVAFGLATLAWTASAAAQAFPVKDKVLLRLDASVIPGTYVQHATNDAGDSADAYAFAIGPRLGLNLGYAPSKLIRIGLGGAAAFSMNVADNQGIPSAQVDGWARWTVGPSVGFRFGPKVPLELDVALNFANFMNLGSQATPTQGGGTNFDLLAKQYGMTNTVLLLFRPGGADDEFAIHAGIEGTWGMADSAVSGGVSTNNVGFLQSVLLGISLGL
jgi:hypothetical protein